VAAELGASEADCGLVAETARLHDAGKLFLPSDLLGDSPPLAGDDRLRYEAHPEHCYRLLLGAGIPDEPARWLRDQCERIDGHGFPRALAADEIALESRIIAAACAYDSVRHQVSSSLALAELRGAAGTALDPDVVAALSAVVARVAS
jgi:HD-GYP domain-containing protein (c-di-GMP phosphodiesterase class II)